MTKTSKIAISLPEEMLAAVEKERAMSGESRSEILRRAIRQFLARRRENKLSERYLHAYEEMPETEQEVAAARHSASAILSAEPWQ